MNKFQKKYNLRTSDFDRYGNLHLSSVLDFFQEAAGAHSVEIGVGCDELLNKNLLWVVMHIRYKIHRMPDMHSNIVVTTWPHKPSRLGFVRDYYIHDDNGNLLIEGTSLWTVIDKDTRKAVLHEDVTYNIEEYAEECAFDGERAKRIRKFEIDETETPYIFTAEYSDLDSNGHVNNTKYARYIVNSLDPQEKMTFTGFQIYYQKEVMLHDKIKIYKKISEPNKIHFMGLNSENEVMFVAEVTTL